MDASAGKGENFPPVKKGVESRGFVRFSPTGGNLLPCCTSTLLELYTARKRDFSGANLI
jgi:hypothetical protein